jgi:hypothetical protein
MPTAEFSLSLAPQSAQRERAIDQLAVEPLPAAAQIQSALRVDQSSLDEFLTDVDRLPAQSAELASSKPGRDRRARMRSRNL